jgi:hypothetical protein
MTQLSRIFLTRESAMKNGGSVLAAALAAAALGGVTSAQAGGAGLRIGTTGLGGDIGWEMAPTLGGRVGLSAGSWSSSLDSGDVHYDAKLKLGNLNAFLDWSPLGPFRISAGLIANNNKVDVTGQPSGSGTYTMNGNTYTAAEIGTLNGTVKPGHSVAPYLGIGYGNVWTKGVNFYFDLGVMFQGSPKASLSVTCGPAATPGQCAAAQNDAAAEQTRLEDSLKKFKYFPVANIGITIGF